MFSSVRGLQQRPQLGFPEFKVPTKIFQYFRYDLGHALSRSQPNFLRSLFARFRSIHADSICVHKRSCKRCAAGGIAVNHSPRARVALPDKELDFRGPSRAATGGRLHSPLRFSSLARSLPPHPRITGNSETRAPAPGACFPAESPPYRSKEKILQTDELANVRHQHEPFR